MISRVPEVSRELRHAIPLMPFGSSAEAGRSGLIETGVSVDLRLIWGHGKEMRSAPWD